MRTKAGWLSDRTGKRKIFVLAGYGFSTLAKVILLVSSSITGLTIFRVIEPKSGSYPAIASCSERFHGGKGRVIFDTT